MTYRHSVDSNWLASIRRRVSDWDQSNYDQGAEWVSFSHGDQKVQLNVTNVRFVVRQPDGGLLTESSPRLASMPWYPQFASIVYGRNATA